MRSSKCNPVCAAFRQRFLQADGKAFVNRPVFEDYVSMNQDIRTPLGLTFLVTGLLLLGYGALTLGSPIYAVCAGVNLNLIWGAVIAAFGIAMLWRRR